MSTDRAVAKREGGVVVKLPAVPLDRRGAETIFASMERELMKVLPKAISPVMLIRTAITALQRQPKLFTCTSRSLCGCLMEVGQLGLTLDANLGHAWLVPFKNGKSGKMEAQLQIGYKGMILMGKDAVDVIFEMEVVYEGEEFKYIRGTGATINHSPPLKRETNSAKIVATYAIAYFPDGRMKFEVMSRDEVEIIRKRAPSARGRSSPWDSDYAEMSKKTTLRRLFKTIPNARLQRAANLDELAAVGISQGLAANIAGEITSDVGAAQFEGEAADADFEVIDEIPDPAAKKKARGSKKKSRSKKSAAEAKSEGESDKTESRYARLQKVGSHPEREEGTAWTEADLQGYLEDTLDEGESLDSMSEGDFDGLEQYVANHDPDGRSI